MNLFLTSIMEAASAGQQAARDGERASDCPQNLSSIEASVWLQAFQDELIVILRVARLWRKAA